VHTPRILPSGRIKYIYCQTIISQHNIKFKDKHKLKLKDKRALKLKMICKLKV